jgi:FMN-dependent NADH-azoreductase
MAIGDEPGRKRSLKKFPATLSISAFLNVVLMRAQVRPYFEKQNFLVVNPMLTLLHIDSSPMGESSISRALTCEFVQAWRHAHRDGKVLMRDLAAVAIPPISSGWIAANFKPKELRTPEENSILELSTEFTGELLRADEYIIGIPMHNWGPASSFKLWADYIVRFGETLAVTPSGFRGLLDKKRATFAVATGAVYSPGSEDESKNFVVPWLRTLFAFLGIRDMHFVVADGSAAVRYGKIGRQDFLAPHLEEIRGLCTPSLAS